METANFFYPVTSENTNTRTHEVNVTFGRAPGRTNMSNEYRETGWLGTTNNRSYYAHGRFVDASEALREVARVEGLNRVVVSEAFTGYEEEYDVEALASMGIQDLIDDGAAFVLRSLEQD